MGSRWVCGDSIKIASRCIAPHCAAWSESVLPFRGRRWIRQSGFVLSLGSVARISLRRLDLRRGGTSAVHAWYISPLLKPRAYMGRFRFVGAYVWELLRRTKRL